MPDLRYDTDPSWGYEFPVPAVNLAVTETAVVPPHQVRCVGVDGRRRGSLRRFPGFRLTRDLTDDVAGLANVERFWYVSIQKGATPYVLRGFVVLADSTTDAAYKALFLIAYDTQDSTWKNYTLEDFAVNDRITGARVLGTWMDHRSPFTQTNASASAAYVRTRGVAYFWSSVGPRVTMLVDVTTGRVIRVLPATGIGATFGGGGSFHDTDDKLYRVSPDPGVGVRTQLHEINLDTGAWTSLGDISGVPSREFTDLAYDRANNRMYAVERNSEELWILDPSARTVSGAVTLDREITVIEYDNTNNKLYGMPSRLDNVSVPQLVKLYEIDVTTGVTTEVFNFDTDFGQAADRALNDRYNDYAQGALMIPDNAGVFYVVGQNQTSRLYVGVDISSGPRTYDSVDVTSTWRYIYAAFEAQDVRRALNRAYFWNPDTATVEGRVASWNGPASLENALVEAQDTQGIIEDNKRVSAAYRLVSRKHALASPLSRLLQVTMGAVDAAHDNHVRLEINQYNLPTDLALKDLDIEVYRTIGLDGSLSADDVPLMGNLYPDSLASLLDLETTATAYVFAGRSEAEYGNAKSDRELTARIPFDFKLQHVGLWPRTALALATDDQLFVVAKPFLGDDPSTRFVELSEKASWRVMWSPPERYELENFRGAVTGEQYRFPNAEATIYSLERAGDFVFACTDLGVIRFHKSGSYVAVNPLAFKWGVQGRDAATAMGSQLMLATSVGLMQVDGQTMQEQGVAAVQRLLSSTEFWRSDLANIHLAYDAQLGALILFNKTQNEMYLLWPDTGGVTSLEDCPWIQSVEGVDPVSGGSPRSFWITSDGKVHTPDAEETSSKKTMYGGSSGDTVNGAATSGSTTTLVDTGAAFASAAKGFWVHFLSGDNAGSKRQISAVTGTQLTWASALSAVVAAGDSYGIAPIPFRVRGHQLPGQRGLDVFSRKIVTGMTANIDLLGGETTSANPNLRMIYKVYRHVGDTSPAEAQVILDEDVTRMAAPLQVQDTILFPEWVCLSSDLDFQLLSGRVSGKMTSSRAISGPVSIS